MPRHNRGKHLVQMPGRDAWYIAEYDGAGKRRVRSTGTAERREAESILELQREDDRRRRRDGAAHPSEFTIAEALEFYAAEHGAHVADPARIGYAIEALLRHFGGATVASINKVACRTYAAQRSVSDGTIRRELGVLSAALTFSVRHQLVTSAPFVFRPDPPAPRERWLSRTEAAKLLNAARNSRADSRLYLPLFIMLGLYTGGRKGALLALRWPQVDLRRGVIDLNEPGRKRTAKGRAVLPIPRRLMTVLRLARQRGSDLGPVIHDGGRALGDIKKSFARVARDAGMPEVTPHVLRHTCATWLAQDGVPMFEIAGWLGQTVERTTEIYAHHSPDHMKGARDALDRRRA